MDFMNFVMALDEALGVDVPEAEYGRLSTLDACVDYLAGRLGIPA
jgi:acyl carrier protein